MNDLIEKLRAVEWEETDDCGRMPDDPTHKCVFVDMRPDDFRALLREDADTALSGGPDNDRANVAVATATLQAEIEALRAEVDALREALKVLVNWTPSADTYRRLGFNPEAPMRALGKARAALAQHQGEKHE